MGEILKLVALGATAAAAVVVAKEVIERNERGEDCSPLAVIKGIGRKIGDLCSEKEPDDDFDDFDDFEPFSVFDDDDDEGLAFDTADMESDKLDDNGFVQLEIEIETSPETETKTEAEAETAAESEAEAESAVEEALKNAAGIDDEAEDSDAAE